MICTFYWAIFILSSILVLGLEIIYNRELDKYFLSMALLLPIISLGYLMRANADTVSMAEWGNRLVYFENSFFFAVTFLCMIHALNIPIRRLNVAIVYSAATVVYLLNYLGIYKGRFYKSMDIEIIPGYGTRFITEPGPLHFVYPLYLTCMFLLILGVIIYGFLNRKKYSFKVLSLFATCLTIMITVYLLEYFLKLPFDISPMAILAMMIGYAFVNDWINSRNMNQIANFIVKESDIERGYIAFDRKKRFLGANKDAYKMFPELSFLEIEKPILRANTNMLNVLSIWMDEYKPVKNDSSMEGKYKVSWSGDKAYKYVVHSPCGGQRYVRRGYYFEITDVTANQKYIEMVRISNKDLKSEVESQTSQISGMQNRVVFGLANMIENRDFSTGGHVKRTSDVVKILVNEMQREGDTRISEEFVNDIIRAAPMHDLGKIAVDNAILLKPSKLLPEEYEQMKVHSEKSGKIVQGILDGVEEQHFVDLSYNVARHHHERWDGKGYPDGLSGENIPLEARIMAVADVYDALVSSRVYKEAMDYETAYCEIIKNMGTQFDPSLKRAFDSAVHELEKYYDSNGD